MQRLPFEKDLHGGARSDPVQSSNEKVKVSTCVKLMYVVLYLQYVVLNLYILANKLQIIQNVPTPTSFDLSTAAVMLLWSSYIKKGIWKKNS